MPQAEIILELNPTEDGSYATYLYTAEGTYDVGLGPRKTMIEEGAAIAEELGLKIDIISVGDE